MKYSTILHEVRKSLGISFIQYSIADTITVLQNNPSTRSPGWCSAKRSYFADFFDLSERTVQRHLKILKEKGLVEEESKTFNLRTTKLWYDVIHGVTEVSPPTKVSPDRSVTLTPTKMSPPYIRYIIPSDNTKEEHTLLTLELYREKIQHHAIKLENELAHCDSLAKYATGDKKKLLSLAKTCILDAIEKRKRHKLHLFSESEFFENRDLFKSAISGHFEGVAIDFDYYYDRVRLWSSSKGKKSMNWADTAISWMISDKRNKKLKLVSDGDDTNGQLAFLSIDT